METKIGNPDNLILMAMVFVTAGLAAMVAWNRRRSLRKLASSNLLPNLLTQGSSAPWLATGLLCGCFFFLTLSLLDLRWGKVEHEIPQKGIEVVFALDVSRSMLAEDAAPNRLERAKQQIKDLMDEMVGDRVGLVAFAGEAKTVIPLTSHYDDFKSTLDGVGPHSIRVGGSRLGTALDVAEKDFLSQTNNHKAIVVLTDGEDQESEPVGIATRLFQEQGIRIFTIGLGDWEQGAKIPVEASDTRRRDRQGYLTFQGDTVWSKQDGQTLKAIALATSGAYIPAGTKFVDMAQVYQTYIAPIEKTEFETATVQAYEARYQWFTVPAILCLLGEVLWRTTAQRNQRDRSPRQRHENNSQSNAKTSRKSAASTSASTSARTSAGTLTKMLILLLFVCYSGYSNAAIAQESQRKVVPLEKTETIRLATEKIKAGAYQDALTLLEKVAPSENQTDLIQYNRGLAQHGLGDLPAAIESFRNAAASNNRQLASQSRYNLGNCLVESAEATEPQQAMAGLNQAIQVYRDALRLDPNYSDARANIETAYQKLQQLKSQQQNQEQQNQEQQNDQNQDQPEQENQSQESQSNDDASQKGSDSQNSESENQEQSEQEQSDQEQSEQQQNRSENQNSDSKEQNDQSNSQQDSTGTDNAQENSDGKENAKNRNAEENKNQSNDDPQDGVKGDQREASDNKDPNNQQNSNQDDLDKQDRQSDPQPNDQTEPQQPDQQDQAKHGQAKHGQAKHGQAKQGQAKQGQPKPDQQSGKADSQMNNPSQPSDDLSSPDLDSQVIDSQVNDSQNSTNDKAENADEETKPQDGQLSSANQPFDNSSTEGTAGQTRAAMTLQEAKKMLQAIRDRDFQRRAELQRRERMQHVPVERDW